MIAATRGPWSASFARRSARSTSPLSAVRTTSTFSPASAADAAFVPCADAGIRHTSRSTSPRDTWYSRIARRPASSPCDPAFGCTETPA